jgi:hypothetical protein
MSEQQKVDSRLIHILACAEMVLSSEVPGYVRQQIDVEKHRVERQADEFDEDPADEALECLMVGVMIIDDRMKQNNPGAQP